MRAGPGGCRFGAADASRCVPTGWDFGPARNGLVCDVAGVHEAGLQVGMSARMRL